ncbi:MAG: UDP-N-acetylmuramate dehydrogenase [Enterobacteriaceae bacterium]
MANQWVSLKDKHTFHLPVRCRELAVVTSVEALAEIAIKSARHKMPLQLLGEGSNVLFMEDFTGVVVLNQIKGIELQESNDAWFLRVGAGEKWHELVCFTLDHAMPGLENLALIPGCCGAAPIQNIGAYGVEFCDICDYVELLDLSQNQLIRLSAAECKFGYRDSVFKHHYRQGFAITHIGIRLPKQWTAILTYGELRQLQSPTAQLIFEHVCSIRTQKLPDPAIKGNAGSFFKNPTVSAHKAQTLLIANPNMPHYPQTDGQIKLAAGWLIDRCQLKGYQRGGAAVHQQQALVLLNQHDASPQDVLALARDVRKRVAEQFSVWLEPEVRFIAAAGEVDAVEALS